MPKVWTKELVDRMNAMIDQGVGAAVHSRKSTVMRIRAVTETPDATASNRGPGRFTRARAILDAVELRRQLNSNATDLAEAEPYCDPPSLSPFCLKPKHAVR